MKTTESLQQFLKRKGYGEKVFNDLVPQLLIEYVGTPKQLIAERETIYVPVSKNIIPEKEGEYFIVYKDYENIVKSESEWTKEHGWHHGARNNIIYWLKPTTLPLSVKMPSDEEIRAEAEKRTKNFIAGFDMKNLDWFTRGAKWLRSQLQPSQQKNESGREVEFAEWIIKEKFEMHEPNNKYFQEGFPNLMSEHHNKWYTTQELFSLFLNQITQSNSQGETIHPSQAQLEEARPENRMKSKSQSKQVEKKDGEVVAELKTFSNEDIVNMVDYIGGNYINNKWTEDSTASLIREVMHHLNKAITTNSQSKQK